MLITKSGKKTWKYDYHIGAKVVTLPLGDFPAISLSEARNLHAQAQAAVIQGRNPFQEQKDAQAKILAAEKANTITFENVCLRWFETKQKDKSEKTQQTDLKRIKSYILAGDQQFPKKHINVV